MPFKREVFMKSDKAGCVAQNSKMSSPNSYIRIILEHIPSGLCLENERILAQMI